ncbi:MAG: lipopolysaccharide biosynthesis protein [Pyrinomonadaceae bacterium]
MDPKENKIVVESPSSSPPSPNEDLIFQTAHLQANIGSRAARGGALAISSQAAKFVVTIIATSVMARLLTPNDYGLIGMVAFFTNFVSMFKDLGLSVALIQQDKISSAQVSNLFWVNVAFSLATTLLTLLLSPAVAWFYGDRRLIGITALTAAGFLLGGLAVQHEGLLRRQMRFGVLATTNLVSMIVGYLVGIAFAIFRFGYWSLVFSQLAVLGTNTVIVWLACRWRPGLPRRNSGVKSMIVFGRNFTGFSIVNYFSRNLDNLLIGKFWGAQQLGLYGRAYQLMTLPLDQINEPITSVAIPALSRMTDSAERYRQAYLRMLQKIAILTMPCVVLMIVTADWLVAIVLGPQWAGTTSIFRLLGIVGIFQPIVNTTGWLFLTQGRSHDMFKWGLISAPITVGSIIAGLPWGALGVATSYSLVQLCITYPLLFWFVGRKGPVRAGDFYRTVSHIAFASLAALIVCYALRRLIEISNPFFGIGFCAVAAIATALLVLLATTSGRDALRDVKNTVLLVIRRHEAPFQT